MEERRRGLSFFAEAAPPTIFERAKPIRHTETSPIGEPTNVITPSVSPGEVVVDWQLPSDERPAPHGRAVTSSRGTTGR